jgi:hypothetical protein
MMLDTSVFVATERGRFDLQSFIDAGLNTPMLIAAVTAPELLRLLFEGPMHSRLLSGVLGGRTQGSGRGWPAGRNRSRDRGSSASACAG